MFNFVFRFDETQPSSLHGSGMKTTRILRLTSLEITPRIQHVLLRSPDTQTLFDLRVTPAIYLMRRNTACKTPATPETPELPRSRKILGMKNPIVDQCVGERNTSGGGPENQNALCSWALTDLT